MIINGKKYEMPELSFDAICELENMGVQLGDMENKPISTIRGFIALAMNCDAQKAGEELQEHLLNGGNINEVLKEVQKAVEKSGFFLALAKVEKAEAAASPKANAEAKK